MKIRCKFFVTKVEAVGEGENKQWEFEASAVTDGSEENKQYWKFTPCGTLNFQGVNEIKMKVGQEVYIDITPCEDDDQPAD